MTTINNCKTSKKAGSIGHVSNTMYTCGNIGTVVTQKERNVRKISISTYNQARK